MLRFISPDEADAAEDSGATQITRLQDVADRLYQLVVNEQNSDAYRTDMGLLLRLSAQYQLGQVTSGLSALETDNGRVYVSLVLSTAWQESCWRQFVMDGTRIRWLESATGDIGLMQVNKHVWRGFYDIERLKWDVLYNAGAGCKRILARMMQVCVDVASLLDPVLISSHLARSALAGYNGGPGACNRWRRREPAALKQIDSSFLDKYEAAENGTQIDIPELRQLLGPLTLPARRLMDSAAVESCRHSSHPDAIPSAPTARCHPARR